MGTADVFDLIRGLELGVPVWRVSQIPARPLSESTYVLLDLRGLDASEVRDRLRGAITRSPVIAVVHPLDLALSLACIDVGAFGAIDPSVSDRMTLRRVLLGALRGEPAFTREVLGLWLRRLHHETDVHGGWRLTARQREVIALVAKGATDKDVAKKLDISVATAQKHVANVLRRLGATNRAAAVNIALMASLIPPEERRLERRPR